MRCDCLLDEVPLLVFPNLALAYSWSLSVFNQAYDVQSYDILILSSKQHEVPLETGAQGQVVLLSQVVTLLYLFSGSSCGLFYKNCFT